MAGVSCVDCVGPAFSLMRKRLFEPFRFAYWSRIAVLGVLAGELSSGSHNGGGGQHGGTNTPGAAFNPSWVVQHWDFIMGAIAAAVVIGLALFYIGSVLRFVLYDAVLRDRARIREGFLRWREQGLDYFSFRLTLVLPYALLAVYLVGWPLLKVIKAGGGGPEIITAFAQLAGALVLVVVLGVLLAVVMVMTKDFVVPQMFFEGITCVEGWRRLWTQVQSEPGSFIGYVLLKIVLAVGSFVVFFIALLIFGLLAIIPAGIVIGIGVVIFKAIGGGMMAIGVSVLLAIAVVVPLITYCIGFVGAPISVFFPAYSMHFYASRYAPLHSELYPERSGGPA